MRRSKTPIPGVYEEEEILEVVIKVVQVEEVMTIGAKVTPSFQSKDMIQIPEVDMAELEAPTIVVKAD